MRETVLEKFQVGKKMRFPRPPYRNIASYFVKPQEIAVATKLEIILGRYSCETLHGSSIDSCVVYLLKNSMQAGKSLEKDSSSSIREQSSFQVKENW